MIAREHEIDLDGGVRVIVRVPTSEQWRAMRPGQLQLIGDLRDAVSSLDVSGATVDMSIVPALCGGIGAHLERRPRTLVELLGCADAVYEGERHELSRDQDRKNLFAEFVGRDLEIEIAAIVFAKAVLPFLQGVVRSAGAILTASSSEGSTTSKETTPAPGASSAPASRPGARLVR